MRRLTLSRSLQTAAAVGVLVAALISGPVASAVVLTTSIGTDVSVGGNLTVNGTTSLVGAVQGANALSFEGVTVDANKTTLTVTDPTAARTITLPDLSGTVTLLGNTATGTGSIVLATSPTLVTPVLGVATATSLTSSGVITAQTAASGLVLGSGINATTFSSGATAARVISFPDAAGTVTVLGNTSTGSGSVVLAASPTLVTPVLGVATGTSLALGGGTALTTTNQTGTGSLVLATSPTLVTPVLGVATATSLTSSGVITAQTAASGLVLGSGLNATTFSSGATAARAISFPDAAGTVTVLGNTSTGSGSVVLAASPTLVTPVLGAATATTLNGLTVTTSTGTLTIANGSTLATSGANSITLTSTGATNVTLPTTGTLVTTANNLSVFAPTTSLQLAGVISDETGSGALVFAIAPTFTGATVVNGSLTLGPTAPSHLTSLQTVAPTVGGSCTTPAVTAGSTDTKGNVTTASCTAGQNITVTFNSTYISAPTCVVSPANAAAAVTASAAPVTFASASTTVLTITTPGAATTAGSWNYICIE